VKSTREKSQHFITVSLKHYVYLENIPVSTIDQKHDMNKRKIPTPAYDIIKTSCILYNQRRTKSNSCTRTDTDCKIRIQRLDKLTFGGNGALFAKNTSAVIKMLRF
jgi:hypothetical protein